MEEFQSAIIGCGSIFKAHAEALQELDEAHLAVVVDINEAKAREAAERYGCRSYTDYRQMLQDKRIQVVHICTPHYLHGEMAIAALQSGKHVLVEKPMAIAFADAEKMIRVARETGKRLGVCFQNRYNYTATRIKNLLDSGRAGRVLHAKAAVKWHRDADYYQKGGWRGKWATEGGGVLITQAIHTLDLLQWFLGEITSVSGKYTTDGLRNIIEVEDTAEAAIKFKSGVTADFFATNCHPVNDPIELDIKCEHLNLKLSGDLTIQSRDGQVERVPEVNIKTGAKVYWGSSHAALISDFYRHLNTGERFLIDGAEGSIALRMVRAIYHSAKCQSEVLWNEKPEVIDTSLSNASKHIQVMGNTNTGGFIDRDYHFGTSYS